MGFSFESEQAHLGGVRFEVPYSQLPWMASTLQTLFPSKVNDRAAEAIAQLKKGEPLTGRLDATFSPSYESLDLVLDRGVYYVKGEGLDFRHLQFSYDPYEVQLAAHYQLNEQRFWISSRSPAAGLEYGQLTLSENPPEFLKSDKEEVQIEEQAEIQDKTLVLFLGLER